MGLFNFFGPKTPPNPYTRKDMKRDINPSRINSPVYDDRYTPLRSAIEYGTPSIVRDLIRSGANIYEKLSNGYPAVITCLSFYRGTLEMIEVLINEGLDVNTSGEHGTLLHHYAEEDEIEIVKFLIYSGADVNSQDTTGRTPLQEAASRGNSKILKLLIDAGGNVNVDKSGESPLFEAILGNSAGIALAFGAGDPRIENVRVLLSAGAIVNKRILDLANQIGNKEVLKMLSDAGAS